MFSQKPLIRIFAFAIAVLLLTASALGADTGTPLNSAPPGAGTASPGGAPGAGLLPAGGGAPIDDPTLVPHRHVYDFAPDAQYSHPATFPGGTLSTGGEVRVVGSTWMTWNPQVAGIHVYYYSGGVADITFTNAVSAAGVKVEPNSTSTYTVTLQAFDASDGLLATYYRGVSGSGGAAFMGLRTPIPTGIKRLRVQTPTSASGFAYSDLTWGNPWASGYLFDDHDHDGVRDPADSLGVPGATVQLLQGSWVMKTATLAKSGWYDLTGLVPGSYCVRPVLPAGYTPTTPKLVCFDSTSVDVRIDFGAGTGSLLRLPWITR